MKLLKTIRLPAIFLLACLLGSCGSGDVPLEIEFTSLGADGASQLNPLEITTSADNAGRGSVHLQVRAKETFEGEIGFLNTIDTELQVPQAGLIFNESDENATSDDRPYELAPLETLSFYVIINPTDCTSTSSEAKRISVSVGPDGGGVSDVVDVWVRTASPVPCP